MQTCNVPPVSDCVTPAAYICFAFAGALQGAVSVLGSMQLFYLMCYCDE